MTHKHQPDKNRHTHCSHTHWPDNTNIQGHIRPAWPGKDKAVLFIPPEMTESRDGGDAALILQALTRLRGYRGYGVTVVERPSMLCSTPSPNIHPTSPHPLNPLEKTQLQSLTFGSILKHVWGFFLFLWEYWHRNVWIHWTCEKSVELHTIAVLNRWHILYSFTSSSGDLHRQKNMESCVLQMKYDPTIR